MRNWFQLLVTLATRWPRACLASVSLLVLASALVVVLGPLDVSTSRGTLLSDTIPHQARLTRFHKRFGQPDSIVLVLSGGERRQRQEVLDRLSPLLEQIPELKTRVLARLGPEQMAEVILTHAPELLPELARAVREQGPRVLDGELAAWARYFERRIQEGLSGESPDRFAFGAESPERALSELTRIIRVLDGELKGRGPRLAYGSMLQKGPGSGQRLDEQGYLISQDGRLHFAVIFPELTSDEGTVLAPLVRRIRQAVRLARKQARAERVEAKLTGAPALAADELRIVREGSRNTSLLSASLILLLLYLAFRSSRLAFLALTPLTAAIVITLAAVEILFDDLNLVTSSFISVLLGLGIDFGVYIFQRYAEEQRSGKQNPDAMRSALLLSGPGVATEAVTTVLAFLTVATIDFTAFAELGAITAVGIGAMAVCAFLLIPPLTRYFAFECTIAPPELPGLLAMEALVARAPRAILAAAALATAAAVYSFLPAGPGFQGRFYDFLPEQTESYVALQQIERNGGMGPAFANFEAGSFEAARALGSRLRAAPEVSQVQTVTDMLPPLVEDRLKNIRHGVKLLDGALGERSAERAGLSAPPGELQPALSALQDAFDEVAFALEQGGRDPAAARELSAAIAALKQTLERLPDAGTGRLRALEARAGAVIHRSVRAARKLARTGAYSPEEVPPLFRSRFLSRDRKLVALYAYPSGDIWQPEVAERFSRKVLAIDPEACGFALNIGPNERLIIDGFERAALMSAALIAVALLLLFRNLGDAALAVVPVSLGWIWMLGVMKPLGLTFNLANMVALPLLLGIGMNTGSQIVFRYRQSRARGERCARLSDLVRGTGAAVVVASLTTMAGFGALMIADYRAMKSLGLMMTTGIGLCLLASVMVLPALLVVLGRARR